MDQNKLLMLIGELYANFRMTQSALENSQAENAQLRTSLEAAQTALGVVPEMPMMDVASEIPTTKPEGEDDGSA